MNHLTRIGVFTALLTLSACAERSESFLEQLATVGISQVADLGTPAPPPALPTRVELEQIPGPLLAVGFAEVAGTGFVTAVNITPDGYVTYQDRTRRSVIVRGGMVTGLQGFRFDLSAVKAQRNDPVVVQTPVAGWPSTLYRNYQFSLKAAPDFQISVKCVITPIARETIDVFDRIYDVTRIQEDCANQRRRFSNTYWADADTGFIWKSVQWVGPRLPPVSVQVVRPHPDGRVVNRSG